MGPSGRRGRVPEELDVAERFARAYERADLDAIVDLLTDDVFMSMPPMPLEYEGRELTRDFVALFFASGRRYRLVPTRAERPAGLRHVPARPRRRRRTRPASSSLGVRDGLISRLTRFETGVLAGFGLPRTLAPE